jgi:hypothetical protein
VLGAKKYSPKKVGYLLSNYLENIKSYKLQQKAQLNRNIPSKFIPKKEKKNLS